MVKGILFFLSMTALAPGPECANANQPLDRPFTLLNQTPFLLEAEYHRMVQGTGPRSYIFPRPCVSALDSSRVCQEPGGWRFADSSRKRTLIVSPLAGYEYRYLRENVHAAEFGIVTQGGSGPVSFFLDARMFTEQYENLDHESYDREFVERQNENASGSLAYTSYSRYRSNLSYDWIWGRLTVARDAAHWGPGQLSNLMFHQNAIPFNQMTFTTHIGPLSVQTLYGQLAASGDWETDTSSASKSLYAHRYEWRATANLLFGISEQLILYKVSAPFAFVPIIPLFITKASEKERLNNGNIAADVSYRLPGIGSVYSEFLIDDLQSPTSLFSDTWSNKWAWMAGLHLIRDFEIGRTGLVVEYSRVEPWVYTHYEPHTAQTAHQDHPLGNRWGPNSQALMAKGYCIPAERYYLGLEIQSVWKGASRGSELGDVHMREDGSTKSFLEGSSDPRIVFNPYASWNGRWLTLWARTEIGDGFAGMSGIQFRY